MKVGRQRRTDVVQISYTCHDENCRRPVYIGRGQAKAAIRQGYPGSALRPVRSCDGRGFHLERLPPEVVGGEEAR